MERTLEGEDPGPPGEAVGEPQPTTIPMPVAAEPEEPTVERTATAAPAPDEARAPTADSVTVRRGDSLWRIAAEHLDADASDAEIAAAWPRWYEANRAVIGSDPNLIHPGQVLRAPDVAPAGTAP